MRGQPSPVSIALLTLVIAASASGVTIDWTPVGNPGNACDPYVDHFGNPRCTGAVGYSYNIGTYEVTNAQYTEFLNAKAASDPLQLYSTRMGSEFGGVTRSGVSGSFSYGAIAGRENMPVVFVSFYDALRFANWLHNGQGSGDTETGAYTLLGGTAKPSNGATVTRNPGATNFLPSHDEWHKAAYHNAIGLSSTDYFDYPAGSNMPTTCSAPTATANRANCNNAVNDATLVGSYPGSASPYGTFDQGGNAFEWNELIVSPLLRGLRGGSFFFVPDPLAASRGPGGANPDLENIDVGFRLVMIPEPSTGLLVTAGLLGLAGWRKRRA